MAERVQFTRDMIEGYLFDDEPLPATVRHLSSNCNRQDRSIVYSRFAISQRGRSGFIEIFEGDWIDA